MATPVQAAHSTRRSRREWTFLLLALLVLAGIVLPPLINIGRYQRRIATAISTSLGRPVHMRSVRLRALPTPGIVMSDFEIEEDPAFGAEPSLRAPSVVAQLSVASLWRGQLEVGRIDLDEASVNLVRNDAGLWNAGAILISASRVQNAPTAQKRPGAAPRFPYISATNARINFKQGVEKTPFSLLNADISMWLSDPDQWQVRLEAQPVRTDLDLDLSDTGLLRVSGRLRRASALGRMPLSLKAEWSHAPLGQMSRLWLGRDPGWRGDLHVLAELTGDPENLNVTTRFEVASMRRSEYTPVEAFDVDATCHAMYRRVANALEQLDCRWPVDDGELKLSGLVSLAHGITPTVAIEAHRLPAGFVLDALRLVRSGRAPALTMSGAVDGVFAYSAEALTVPGTPAPVISGSARVQNLSVRSAGGGSTLTLPLLELSAAPAATGAVTLTFPPTPVRLGEAARRTAPPLPSLLLSGRLGADASLLHWTGEVELASLSEWADLAAGRPALLPLAPGTEGTADLDVTMRGESSMPEGTIHLHNTRYAPDFLPEPVLIPAATVVLGPASARWSAPVVYFHKLPFAVSAEVPLGCAHSDAARRCPTRFDVTTEKLDASQTEAALLGGGGYGELLDSLLAKLDLRATRWPALTGTLHAGAFTVGTLAIKDATAHLSIDGGSLHLDELSGRALGGGLRAEGNLDVTGGTPVYRLATSISGATARAVGALFIEDWGPGAVDLQTKMELSGYTPEQLAASAKGSFHADWVHGVLPGRTPLARFERWTLDGTIDGKKLVLGSSKLAPSVGRRRSASGVPLPVTGTISFDGILALTVGSVPVSGTISSPLMP